MQEQLLWLASRELNGFAQDKSSQVKSAPTPAGEPNVRAEAEKRKNICTPKKMPNPVQPTSISQGTSKK